MSAGPSAATAVLPEYVQIEPVGQCNLRCRMCAIRFRRDGPPHGPPAFMDFDVFVRIVDGMTRMKTLHLQGLGEPLMHPRFFDMVRYAAAKGARVTTNSNLTLLGERRAQRCVSSGLAELHVSLDGASAATFEAIRTRARHERVIRNLERLVAARDAGGTGQPRIAVVFVVMRMNLHELPQLVAQAAERGVDEVFVQHLCHDFGESALPERYRPMREFISSQTVLGDAGDDAGNHDVEAVFDAARREAERNAVKLRLPRVSGKAAPGCDWPWRGAYVSFEGLAMPCCMIGTPDRLNFGSVAEHGVEGLWNGAGYRAFRERLGSSTPPEICRSCSLYHGTF